MPKGNLQTSRPGHLTQWDQIAVGLQHNVSVQIPLSRRQPFPFFLGEDYSHVPEQVWPLEQQAGMLFYAYIKEISLVAWEEIEEVCARMGCSGEKEGWAWRPPMWVGDKGKWASIKQKVQMFLKIPFFTTNQNYCIQVWDEN